MTFKNVGAGEVGNIVDSHGHVDGGSDETGSNGIEIEIKDFISMSSEYVHALSTANIP